MCGIVPGLGGCQKVVYIFFRVIPYGGEKHINKIPPKIPGQSRENVVYVFCSLCVSFRSQFRFAKGVVLSLKRLCQVMSNINVLHNYNLENSMVFSKHLHQGCACLSSMAGGSLVPRLACCFHMAIVLTLHVRALCHDIEDL